MVQLIGNIIAVIVSIWLLSKYNIVDSIPFVPTDQSFEVGLTIYTPILLFLFSKLTNLVTNKLVANVKCIFYRHGEDISINNTPVFIFNNDGVLHIKCKITVNGSAKRLKKEKMLIAFPQWVDIQSSNALVVKTHENQCIVNFSNLINTDLGIIEDGEIDFKISLIMASAEEIPSLTIKPILAAHWGFLSRFKHNSFKINGR